MTTTVIQTKSYERLDGYIDRIINSLQKSGEIIQEYLNVAKEEGMEEQEAWKYLKGRIPKATYYRYLPQELKDPNKQQRRKNSSGLTETKTNEFDTKGMGVVITDDETPETEDTPPINPEPEEQTQSVSCPAPSDEEHDKLVARIQEQEKMISDLSFQKANETITPPAQQIIILPHNMVLDVYDKRMKVGLEGFMQLKTENNIVVGVEIVNVTQTK